MVYEYEEPNSFFPMASTEVIKTVLQYQHFEGPLDAIRLPRMAAEEVSERGQIMFNREVKALTAAYRVDSIVVGAGSPNVFDQ